MPEQSTLEFYTLHADQKIVADELQKEPYDATKAAEILREAAGYQIDLATVEKSWYMDEEEQSCVTKPIDPETILVKDGHFYGCLLVRERSEWGYRCTIDEKQVTAVTLDAPRANVDSMDHSCALGGGCVYWRCRQTSHGERI